MTDFLPQRAKPSLRGSGRMFFDNVHSGLFISLFEGLGLSFVLEYLNNGSKAFREVDE
jgi:hypothetical protein